MTSGNSASAVVSNSPVVYSSWTPSASETARCSSSRYVALARPMGLSRKSVAGVPVPVSAPVVAAQGRHRAVQRDRGGEQLPAGEDVAHLSDRDALGTEHRVRLEDLDGDALGLQCRLHTAQQQGHTVPAQVGVLLEGRVRGLVDDLAEPLGERGLVGFLEADPQELLAGPLPQPFGEPGEPLRGAERREGRLDQAAEPVDDGLAVALQLGQLVGEHTQPGREGRGPLLGVVGECRRGEFPDLLPRGGADLFVPGGVGVPYEDVARLAYGTLRRREVGGAAAQ